MPLMLNTGLAPDESGRARDDIDEVFVSLRANGVWLHRIALFASSAVVPEDLLFVDFTLEECFLEVDLCGTLQS